MNSNMVKPEKSGHLHLVYHCTIPLKIYKRKPLESKFTEVLSSSNKNTIVRCTYKHADLTTVYFNFDFLQPLIDKLATENKNIVLFGDFHVDPLHYESNNLTREFLDLIFSVLLTPQITIPTCLTVHSKTLIDNIFTNSVEGNSISGNLQCCISDHLAQFIFASQIVLEQNNHRKYKRNYKNLDAKNLRMNFKA